jgi:hypothetical protein
MNERIQVYRARWGEETEAGKKEIENEALKNANCGMIGGWVEGERVSRSRRRERRGKEY